MRQKRVKSYRKVMQFYCSAFKFREPYQLLVDAAFVTSCVKQKLDFYARLQDVLQGAVKPMITQCCMQALYDVGKEGQGAVDLAKEFERRKCNHFEARPEDECMQAMAGKDNPNRYVVATQSLPLRKSLRSVPGLPIIYINRSVVLLESPSDQTMAKKTRMEREKLHASSAELALLSTTPSLASTSTALIDSHNTIPGTSASTSALAAADAAQSAEVPKKKKRKGPKGPNPLSVKKKKSESTTGGGEKKEKRESDPVEMAAKVERKRKRNEIEQNQIVSLASRNSKRGQIGATEVAAEGERPKKNHNRGKRGAGGSKSTTNKEGTANGDNDVE